MNPYLRKLIERERSRVADLQKRIEHYERRLNMLLELSQDDEEDPSLVPVTPAAHDDAVATAPAPGVQDPSETVENAGGSEAKDLALPKKISANSLKLLRYFGQGQKTLDEATAFSKDEGLGMDRRNISSFANIYRNKFGLIESPAVGLYRLTSRGKDFVESRYKPIDVPAVDPADGL